MIRVPRFTKDELRLLDEKSTENMIVFYEEEMRRVAEGENPSFFLSPPLIKRFTNLGILERGWKGKRRKITLSRKGRELYDLRSS